MANKTIPTILTNEGNVGIGISRSASLNTTAAANGTGGGNRGFDTSFSSTTTGFTGSDSTDQGFGYFAATIVSGRSYEVSATMVVTNGAPLSFITSSGLNFATQTVQSIASPPVSNTTYRFVATADAAFFGIGINRTSGTMTAVVSNFSIKEVGSTLVTSDTNVGIGVASPTSLLHISGAAPTIKLQGSSSASAKVDLAGAYTTWSLENQYVNGATNDMFRIYNSALSADAITINRSTNNVGIGTTNPSSKLHIDDATTPWITISRAGVPTWQLRNNFPSNQYGFSFNNTTAGTVPLFIGAGGNIGIGLDSPAAKLDIVGTASTIALSFGTTVPNNPLFINTYAGSMGIGMDQTTAGIRLAGDYASAAYPLVDIGYYSGGTVSHANWVNRLRVQQNGNVGIGITNPASKLHVSGAGATIIRLDAETLTSVAQFQVKANTDGVLIAGMYGPNPVAGTVFGANTSGAAFLGTTTLATVHPTLLAIGTSNIIPIIFGTNSTERMRIDGAGNVGIGTTNPVGKLTVQGNIEVNYNSTTADTYVRRSFLTTHATINRGANITFGLFDGGSNPMGMTVYNVAAAAGAYNSQFIAFYTHEGGVNEGERMRITQSGNVGIGTFTPLSLLTVGEAGSTSAAKGLSFGGDASANLYRSAASTIKTDGSLEVTTSLNIGADLYVADELGVGVLIANKRVNYGAQISAASASIQLVLGRTVDSTGQGAIGADNGNTFAVWNVSGGFTKQFVVTQQGNVGIGSISPGAKLDVNGDVYVSPNTAGKNTFILSTNASNDARLLMRSDVTTKVDIQANGTSYFNGGNVGIGETSPIQKLHVLGNTVFGNFGSDTYKYNLYLSFAAAADESWVRIYLPQDYQSNNNGGTVKLRVLFAASHASFGAHQEYQISYKTYYPQPFLTFSKIICTNKTTDFGGGTFYTASSTPDVIFYSNADAYLYIKIKGFSAYNTVRFVEAEVFGRVAAVPTITTTTAPASPTELTKTIQFLPQEGNIYADGAIGIGITNPAHKLDIYQTSNDAVIRSKTTAAGAYAYLDSATVGYYGLNLLNAGTSKWFVGGYGTTSFTITKGIGVNEYFRIDTNGNVGIGTDNPTAKLVVMGEDIYNYAKSSVPTAIVADSVPEFLIGSTDNIDGEEITLRMGSVLNTYYTYGAYIKAIQGAGVDYYKLAFGTSNGAAATTKMTITNDGNVGIGTTNPLAPLHVGLGGDWPSSTGTSAMVFIKQKSSNVGLVIQEPGNASFDRALHLYTNGSLATIDATYRDTGPYPDIAFVTSGTVRARINSDGNVGIGTNSPHSRLDLQLASAATRYLTLSTNDGQGSANGFGLNFRIADQAHNIAQIRGSYETSVGGGDGGLFFATRSAGVLSDRLSINANGRVGIGVSFGTTLLSVGGAGSTLPASGITFGANSVANLYRSEADHIKTDGSFVVTNTLIVGGGQNGIRILKNGSDSISSNLYIANAANTRVFNFQQNAAGTNLALWSYNSSNTFQNLVNFNYNGSVGIGTITPSGKLHIVSTIAGETVLRTDGTNGTLFSVVDDLSDSLMSVNNSAGLPVLEVFADDRVVAGQYGSGDFVLINNKVGIGTTNPTNKLSVIGGASIGPSTYNVAAPSDGLIVEGKVGIGTTNPVSKLHVKSPLGQDGIMIDATTYSEVAFKLNGGTVKSYLSLSSVAGGYINGSSVNSLIIRNDSDIFMSADAGGTSAITIKNGGNVGIGATNPNGRLDVRTAGQAGVPALGTAGNGINLTRTDGQTGGSIGYTTEGHVYIQSQRFDSVNSNNLFLQPVGGNVGIGLTTPADKLEVNGTTRTKKLRSNGIYYVGITGTKSSNASAFDMFDISNTGGNQTIEIVLSHHHSGGGQHGSFRRVILALNSYVAFIVLEDTSTDFGGGLGFTITRTNTSTMRIGWAGATAFASGYSFIGWIKGNGDYSVTNVGMDSLDAA